MSTQSIRVELRAITAQYDQAMKTSAGNTQKFERTVKGSGPATASLASQVGTLAKGFIGPAALGFALKSGVGKLMSYEDALVGVGKTTGLTGAALSALGEDLTDLAGRVEGSAEDMLGIAQTAAQLGIAKKDIVAFTETIAGIATATDLTADTAATGMARLANIVQLPTDKFANLGSTFVALGNNMATTEPEILAMSLRVASAGRAAGLTIDQILGLSAAASSLGLEAEAGGSALSMTLVAIQEAAVAGGPKLATFAQIAGMSATQFADAWKAEPVAAFDAFLGGLNSIQESGGDVAGVLDALGLDGLRVSDSLRRMSGAQEVVNNGLGIAATAYPKTSDLLDEVTAANERASVAFDQLGDQLDENIRVFLGGEEGTSGLATAVNGLTSALDALASSDLRETTQANLDAQFAWADALERVSTHTATASDELGFIKGAVGDYTTATGAAIGPTDELSAALLDQEAATLAAHEASVMLADQLRASVDPAFAFVSAQDAVKAATDAYNEAVKDSGVNSDEAASAAMALFDAQIALDGAAIVTGDSMAEAARQIDRLEESGRITASMADDLRAKLRDARVEAEDLAGNYRINLSVQASSADRAMLNTARFAGLEQRAKGGPVEAGIPYLVGEYGPELYVPETAGRIVNAAETARIGTTAETALMAPAPTSGGGGGSVKNYYTLSAPNYVGSNRELLNVMTAELAKYTRQGGTIVANVARQ